MSGKAIIAPKGDGTYMVMWWEQVGDRSDMYGRDFRTREEARAFARSKGLEVESEAESTAREAEAAVDPTLAFVTGVAYAKAEHWDDAARAFESAARRNPKDAQTRRYLGMAYLELERLDDAVREAEAAVRLDPKVAEAHHLLGITYTRQQRWDDAARAFESAVRLEPGSARAHRDLGVALLKSGELGRSVEELERYLKQEDGDGEAHYLLACAHGLSKNMAGSRREARRAAELGYGRAKDLLDLMP
jgi:tetratricopeptide (TPR) repeat protein